MRTVEPAETVALAALIEQFRRTALAKADGLPCRHDRELHQQLHEAIRELQRYGQPGSVALKILLEDGSPHVRRWVAPHVLFEGNSAGHEVLLRDSELPGTCGEAARMALRDWKAGRLTSPFGASETGPVLQPLVAERRNVRTRQRTTSRPLPPERERRELRDRRERSLQRFGADHAQETAASHG